jgi:hypothetical protein
MTRSLVGTKREAVEQDKRYAWVCSTDGHGGVDVPRTYVLMPALATVPRTRAVCPSPTAATGVRAGSAGLPGVHATWAVAMARTLCSVLRRGRWVRSVLMQSLMSFTLNTVYLLKSDGSGCHCKKLLRIKILPFEVDGAAFGLNGRPGLGNC